MLSHYKHQQVEASVPVLLFHTMQLLEVQSKQAAGGALTVTSSLLHSAHVAGQEITWGQLVSNTDGGI